MLEESRLKDDEYEKQYYGFSCTELYADFKEQTCKAIKTALSEIEAAMKEKGYNETEWTQKITELYTSYMESSKIPLEKFKNEARQIFEIPKNVVLNEDRHKTEHYTDEDIKALKKEVAELEKELLKEQVFLAKCTKQKEIIDTIFKPTYDKTNFILKSLKSDLKNAGMDENKKKLLDLHEQHVQYYFGNENDTEENLSLLAEKDFLLLTQPNDFEGW